MARDFDSVDDVVTATVTAVDSGGWTMASWIRPDSAGEGPAGRIISLEASGAERQVSLVDSNRHIQAVQHFSPVNAQSVSTNTHTYGEWACVVATFDAAAAVCRLFQGSLTAPMAEVAYDSQVAGSGTRLTGATTLHIGNRSAAVDRTFDGRIANACFDAREWSLGEMEAFRLGTRPVNTGSMRGFWPLDSPTAAQAEDLSGNGANGTVTGAIVAEHPPIPMGWAGAPIVLAPTVAVQTLRPDGDIQVGSWENELGAATNLFQSIDEASTDDADYVTRSL